MTVCFTPGLVCVLTGMAQIRVVLVLNCEEKNNKMLKSLKNPKLTYR